MLLVAEPALISWHYRNWSLDFIHLINQPIKPILLMHLGQVSLPVFIWCPINIMAVMAIIVHIYIYLNRQTTALPLKECNRPGCNEWLLKLRVWLLSMTRNTALLTIQVWSSGQSVLDITCVKVCEWLVAGLWYSLGTPVFAAKHLTCTIWLKVVLNIHNQEISFYVLLIVDGVLSTKVRAGHGGKCY
jgi:hypothetical protein